MLWILGRRTSKDEPDFLFPNSIVMTSLLNVFLQFQPFTSIHSRDTILKDCSSPSFIILHDGRYQSMVHASMVFFCSEITVIGIPVPHLNVIYHYLQTKEGSFLGYAIQSFNLT